MESSEELSREEVLRIAHLARLSLSEEEIALYQKRLGRVLGYVEELKQVSTSEDEFPSHVPKDAAALRQDKKEPFEASEALLENAPQKKNKHFIVPAVMDET